MAPEPAERQKTVVSCRFTFSFRYPIVKVLMKLPGTCPGNWSQTKRYIITAGNALSNRLPGFPHPPLSPGEEIRNFYIIISINKFCYYSIRFVTGLNLSKILSACIMYRYLSNCQYSHINGGGLAVEKGFRDIFYHILSYFIGIPAGL
jgi:hypothetical protein